MLLSRSRALAVDGMIDLFVIGVGASHLFDFGSSAVRSVTVATLRMQESQALQNFAAWFLSKAAPLYPEEFEGVSENVADLLLNTETITLALRVLSSMGECFRVRSSKLMLVNEKLAELTLSADVQDEAKWAARALTRMNGDDVTLPVWVQLLPTLRQRLSNFEHDLQLESVAGALMTFSQFASKSPAVWTACEEEAVDFSFKLLNGEFALTVSTDNCVLWLYAWTFPWRCLQFFVCGSNSCL